MGCDCEVQQHHGRLEVGELYCDGRYQYFDDEESLG